MGLLDDSTSPLKKMGWIFVPVTPGWLASETTRCLKVSLQRQRDVLDFDAMKVLPVHIQANIVGMFGCDCKAVSGVRLRSNVLLCCPMMFLITLQVGPLQWNGTASHCRNDRLEPFQEPVGGKRTDHINRNGPSPTPGLNLKTL